MHLNFIIRTFKLAELFLFQLFSGTNHSEMGVENALNDDALTKSKIDPPPLSPPPTHIKKFDYRYGFRTLLAYFKRNNPQEDGIVIITVWFTLASFLLLVMLVYYIYPSAFED